MKSLLPQKAHYYIYIFSIILLVIGMPLSKFLMSLSQIILICNWVLSGHLKSKFSSFFNNKAALVLSSLLLLHFIGLLYTIDYAYAYGDLRIKVPLFILPLILSTSPALPKKITDLILHLFVGAIIVASAISTLILFNVIHRHIVDIRNISIFISHIRFALLVCIAVFISIYLMRGATQQKLKIVYAGITAWLLLFLVLMESMTGIAALIVVVAVFVIYKICRLKQAALKYSILLVLVGITVYSGSVIYSVLTTEEKTDVVDFTKLEPATKQGNGYYHDTTAKAYTENGHYIWLYYCESELKEEWQKRSNMDFNWKDKKGNVLRFTLARFMTSKNLRKDAEGMKQLSDDDIRAVERGVVNADYQNISSIKGRLHELGWEIQMYKTTGDANDHSLTQRFEYWKAATGIIATHPLIGVGTGDIKNAFDEQYEKTNSGLKKEFRFRSHNQYLSMAVAFGIIGLLWFLITLIYPMIKLNKTFDFLYITFFIVATVSFLTEDTLETQAGVNFYAFFNAFFLFVHNSKKD
ncbi:MAG: hypothetical protein JWP12_1305 [Bacteroidetes bacterium]|nr:hypothetical protein [Bacteroidota bacterium]